MTNKVIDETASFMKSGLNFWTQDQAEKFGNTLIKQGNANKDEAAKFATELWEQGKKNQEQMQKMVNEAATTAFTNFKEVTQKQFDELTLKFDELAKKFNPTV